MVESGNPWAMAHAVDCHGKPKRRKRHKERRGLTTYPENYPSMCSYQEFVVNKHSRRQPDGSIRDLDVLSQAIAAIFNALMDDKHVFVQ